MKGSLLVVVNHSPPFPQLLQILSGGFFHHKIAPLISIMSVQYSRCQYAHAQWSLLSPVFQSICPVRRLYTPEMNAIFELSTVDLVGGPLLTNTVE